NLAGLHLVSHAGDGFRGRSDEGNAGGLTETGKLGIFRKKTVTRVNAIRPGPLCEVDDRLHVEKALYRAGSDEIGLVGLLHVDGSRFAFRVDGDGADPQLSAGPDDPH